MNKKLIITGVVTLLFLYLIYTLKGLSAGVDLKSSGLSMVFYVGLYLVLTLYYCSSYPHMKEKNKLFSSLFVFLLYAFFVNFITVMFGPGEYGRIAIFLTPIPIMTLLFFTRFINKEPQLVDYSQMLISVFIVLMGVTYFIYREKMALSLNNENIAANISYFLMYSLPLAMCVKKGTIRYALMLFILLAVMISFKRTGSAATLLAIIVYVFVDRFLTSKISLKTIIGMIVVVGAVSYVVITISSLTEGYLLVRFTQALDNGDPRDELREIAFKMIINSDFFPLLFGHGYDMMMFNSPEKLPTHNDYLEVTYDYGIIGLLLYLNIYLQLIKYGFKLLKLKSRYAAPLFASIVLLSLCSFFSHIFLYHHYSSLLILFWAITIGNYRQDLYVQQRKESCIIHYQNK